MRFVTRISYDSKRNEISDLVRYDLNQATEHIKQVLNEFNVELEIAEDRHGILAVVVKDKDSGAGLFTDLANGVCL